MAKRIAQTKQLALEQLSFYPANPRRGDVAAIRASLEATGQYRAIVVRSDTLEVLAGNHTLQAMRELGYEKALCHLVDVDDESARRIVLADNRTAELATYDEQALADLLGEMDDLAGSGWEQAAVDELLAGRADPERDTEPSPVPGKPRTKPGELYVLGEHRLLCGDATGARDAEKLMGGGVAEMVLTDPPYGVEYEGKTAARLTIANDSNSGLADLVREVLTLAYEHSAPGAAALLFHPDSVGQGLMFRQAFAAAGFGLKQVLIWAKQQFVLGRQDYHWQHEPILYGWKPGAAHRWHGGRKRSTLLDDSVDPALLGQDELVALVREYRERELTTVVREDRPQASGVHPTMKPVRLCARLIANSSRRGEIVLDPFAGSGSTLIACENLGRRCFAMEIDAGYVDVIVDRWQRHTGLTATLAS